MKKLLSLLFTVNVIFCIIYHKHGMVYGEETDPVSSLPEDVTDECGGGKGGEMPKCDCLRKFAVGRSLSLDGTKAYGGDQILQMGFFAAIPGINCEEGGGSGDS